MIQDNTITPAIRVLQRHKVAFIRCPYRYEDNGGARAAADQLGVDLHRVVKTLVMADSRGNAVIVLMHGDRQVSNKTLARVLGQKAVAMCSPAMVQQLTGYVVGGTSPLGTKKKLPVYMEKSILALPEIWLNAGKRGLLVKLATTDLVAILQPIAVEVAR